MRDDWHEPGWSAPADRAEILGRFRARAWRGRPRKIVCAADRWLKWALFDADSLSHWGPLKPLGRYFLVWCGLTVTAKAFGTWYISR
jgi:hypothetical protein